MQPGAAILAWRSYVQIRPSLPNDFLHPLVLPYSMLAVLHAPCSMLAMLHTYRALILYACRTLILYTYYTLYAILLLKYQV